MSEWSFFLPSLIATLVGAALGIPIGLWLNRRAGEYQRHREEQQARQRKVAVLKALQEEVTHNLHLLNQMEDQLNKGGMPFYSLDTDMWMLLGGEVAQAVASEDMLTRVSRLYFEFEHIKRKLDAVFRNYADPDVAARGLGTERTAELRAATLGHMSPAKSLCKEVLELLRQEIAHVAENPDARKDRKPMVGDGTTLLKLRVLTDLVGSFSTLSVHISCLIMFLTLWNACFNILSLDTRSGITIRLMFLLDAILSFLASLS